MLNLGVVTSPVLTLLHRRDCHLCDEMESVVRSVIGGTSVRLDLVDVEGDAELRERYGDQVPVLLIDGRRAFKYRLTPAALRRRLGEDERRRERRWWRRVASLFVDSIGTRR
jgi:hypothetical protein